MSAPELSSPSARGVTSWFWGDEAVAAIVERERSMVLTACLAAVCRLASAQRNRNAFEVAIPALARAMGAKDVKAARRALWQLNRLGVIIVHPRKRDGRENLPHLVQLVEGARLGGGSFGGSTPREDVGRAATDPGSRHDVPSSPETTQGGSSNGRRSSEVQDVPEVEEPIPHPSQGEGADQVWISWEGFCDHFGIEEHALQARLLDVGPVRSRIITWARKELPYRPSLVLEAIAKLHTDGEPVLRRLDIDRLLDRPIARPR